MKNLQIKTFAEYKKAYQKSVEDPEAFWDEIANTFTWQKKWDKTLEWDFSKPEVKWFQGGKLNITENCLDRHLEKLGNKTAIMLIVLTDGFSNFENARQLCSYTGITPNIRVSGSSVRGRSRITKMGNAKLRNLLFMCSFSACKHNKACREIYERIIAKGKSKKLALIAVCNKLLKQAFAIAKSGLPYEEKFVSKLS